MNFLLRLSASVVLLGLPLVGSVAMADVVAVVSAQNSVTALNRSQVVDLFLGKSRRFPNGTVAVPIDQAEGTPARDEFYKTFADKSPAQIKAYWSKIVFTGRGRPPLALANGPEVRKRIAANSAAIGYLDRSLLDASVRELP